MLKTKAGSDGEVCAANAGSFPASAPNDRPVSAANPALTPKDCAQALQISERYLYRVLASHGERFSQVQLGKRLDASAERLRDPRFSRYQIASIAYQCGFKDPAHFSRVFSKRFGVTPRGWRAYDGMSI